VTYFSSFIGNFLRMWRKLQGLITQCAILRSLTRECNTLYTRQCSIIFDIYTLRNVISSHPPFKNEYDWYTTINFKPSPANHTCGLMQQSQRKTTPSWCSDKGFNCVLMWIVHENFHQGRGLLKLRWQSL